MGENSEIRSGPGPGEIIFSLPGKLGEPAREVLRLSPDGFYVEGRKVDVGDLQKHDLLVYKAFKEFLEGAKVLHPVIEKDPGKGEEKTFSVAEGVRAAFADSDEFKQLQDLISTHSRMGQWKDTLEESMETLCPSCIHFESSKTGPIPGIPFCAAHKVAILCTSHQIDGEDDPKERKS